MRSAMTAIAGLTTLALVSWAVERALASEPAPADQVAGFAVQKTEAQWRAQLEPEQYRVLREEATERAFSGRYWDTHTEGTYQCAGCGQPLFASDDKYESGTGWPSFTRPIAGGVATTQDRTLWMVRTEVHCARCGGHLGHVFDDGPAPTGKRYCMNSASLKLEPKAAAE